MPNPISYLIENISWYEPIYNISWGLFIIFALVLPIILLAMFHYIPGLKSLQSIASWKVHRQTFWYLVLAALAIFAFRLIPYWIFNDKILHFLGGGVAIGFIYEYFVVNFQLKTHDGLISLKKFTSSPFNYLVANLIILLLFVCFFSIFSEFYEYISKAAAGAEFDSSGIDTWEDIAYNIAGGYVGYFMIWIYKYAIKKDY